jgi:hypothetical protein
LIKFIHLAIIMLAVYAPVTAPWAMPALATINIIFAAVFYWLCFGLLSGTRASGLNPDMVVADAWTSRVIQAGGTTILFATGDPTYQYIALMSVPWIVISVFTDTLGTLIAWNIVEIQSVDSDESD